MDLELLDSFDEGIVVIDRGAAVVYFNPSAERLFGYRATEVLGKPIDLLIPESTCDKHGQWIAEFACSEIVSRRMRERGTIAGRRKDGSVFDAEASIARFVQGGDLRLMAVVRDITERVAAECRLLASEQKHRAILDTCADAIVLADAATGRICEVNERAGTLLGCATSELLGLHLCELYPHPGRDAFCAALMEHIAGGSSWVSDVEILRRDGSVLPAEITSRPTDVAGRRMAVCFFRDIGQRKEHERQLDEARRAAEAASHTKSLFLANMSHELRTPLNAIIGMSEVIAEQMKGPVGHPKYVEYAVDIRDSGHHLLELINDILDLSRLELDKISVHDEVIELGPLLGQCYRTVHAMAEEAGTWISIEANPTPLLRADRRMVRQMVLNLLSNAIKFTPPGGLIVVAAREHDAGSIEVSVQDTGVGIQPERLATVAEPFNLSHERHYQNRAGTGLGLSITKGLLARHGGSMQIESTPGEGTRVSLRFPADRAIRT